MSHDDICFQPAADSARLIATRKLSPVELVDALLARIEAVEPKINAFTMVCGDSARDAARKAEDAVMHGDDLGPLHGVPFTVKDMINVAGLPITWGSHMFADNVPGEDAVTVERLRAAGGIVLGITTMPELGPKGTTASPRYGITRNPWNLERTPGGSSGGAAAALATGCSALALGTDRAGSVRIPASCCGGIGLKPTAGVFPDPEGLDVFEVAYITGPMTRTVADAALMMGIIAGPHPADPRSHGSSRRDYASSIRTTGSLKGTRIAWAAKIGNAEVDHETRSQCEGTLRRLEELGAEVEEIEIDLMESVDILYIMTGINMHFLFADKLAIYGERIDPAIREAIALGGHWTGRDVAEANLKRTKLFRDVESVLSGHDLIATPALASPPLAADHYAWDPVVINGRTLRSPRYDWFCYNHPFNHTGHPAISVPCGWTSGDLPVGLQIVGPWYGENRLLRIAAEIEVAQPWSHRKPALVA